MLVCGGLLCGVPSTGKGAMPGRASGMQDGHDDHPGQEGESIACVTLPCESTAHMVPREAERCVWPHQEICGGVCYPLKMYELGLVVNLQPHG